MPIPEPSRRVHASAALAGPFERVCALFASSGLSLELRESVARLLTAAVMSFGPAPARRAWRCPAQAWTTEPMASFLARGMSYYQAWRAFKRHYGLPPYDYQLRVRNGLAQRARSGRAGRRRTSPPTTGSSIRATCADTFSGWSASPRPRTRAHPARFWSQSPPQLAAGGADRFAQRQSPAQTASTLGF